MRGRCARSIISDKVMSAVFLTPPSANWCCLCNAQYISLAIWPSIKKLPWLKLPISEPTDEYSASDTSEP